MAAPQVEYGKETRMAVVMYGGVSLAVYMNGVAQELLSIVRSSARGQDGRALPEEKLRGAGKVYRRIAQWQGSGDVPDDPQAPVIRRFTIDAISGTSAGGINGIFLAKALVNDESFAQLAELWKEEAELGKLLNDAKSVRDVALAAQDPPAALLNGQRMYLKLLHAFEGMTPTGDDLRNVDEMDLYVTTTDVRGQQAAIRIAGGTVTEKRYRQAFHLHTVPATSRRDAEARERKYSSLNESEGVPAASVAAGTAAGFRDPFDAAHAPLLAFIARCTSSFPFAFEPFCWNDAVALSGRDVEDWDAWLRHRRGVTSSTPFTDGGALDNKPFSYVTEALSRRESSIAIERKLLYVEPDPEPPHRRKAGKPNAIENAIAGVVAPGYEPIRDDLQAVMKRNELADALTRIGEKVAQPLKAMTGAEWIQADGQDAMEDAYGRGYLAYHELKIDAVVDFFAEAACAAVDIDPRDERARILHDLVARAISEDLTGATRGETWEYEAQFLLNFDVPYRLRKFGFALRHADELEKREIALGADPASVKAAFSAAKDELAYLYWKASAIRQQLAGVLRGNSHAGSGNGPACRVVKALDAAGWDCDVQSILARPVVREAVNEALRIVPEKMRQPLMMLADETKAAMRRIGKGPASKVAEALASYEAYDTVMFPIMHVSEIGELAHVDIIRVSPLDTANPADPDERAKKLAGKSLGHFAAFLEKDWRHRDIVWGRLDAAEVLIRQMLAGAPPAEIERVLREAQEAIVEEELREDCYRRFADRCLEGKAPQSKEILQMAAERVLQKPSELFRYFVGRSNELERDAKRTLTEISRGSLIVHSMISAIAADPVRGVLTRVGMMLKVFSALVQLAIPHSLLNVAFRSWVTLAYVIFAAIAVSGYLYGSRPVLSFGVRSVGLVLLVHFVVMLLEAVMNRSRWILRPLFKYGGIALLGAIVLGAAFVGLGPRVTAFAQTHSPEPYLQATADIYLKLLAMAAGAGLGARLMGSILSWLARHARKFGRNVRTGA